MPFYTKLDSEECYCSSCEEPQAIFLLVDKKKKLYKCSCGKETLFVKKQNGTISFKEVK